MREKEKVMFGLWKDMTVLPSEITIKVSESSCGKGLYEGVYCSPSETNTPTFTNTNNSTLV